MSWNGEITILSRQSAPMISSNYGQPDTCTVDHWRRGLSQTQANEPASPCSKFSICQAA